MKVDHQARLDAQIDGVLDILGEAEADGVELDPLQTILARMRERGAEIDLAGLPPMARMLLDGIIS